MNFSIRLVAFAIAVSTLAAIAPAQKGRQNRGKLGIWYWTSQGLNPEVAENDDAPVLERPGDARRSPKAPLTFSLTFPSITFGQFKSVQVNVSAQGTNILGDAANEPSFAVDPTNPNRIVAGWRQFDNVQSNFRQAGNAYSSDGGLTWNNRTVFTPGTFRSDPVLDADASGRFYYNSLQQTFFTDLFRSLNFGFSYNLLGPATGGDKQWMTIDKTNGIGRGNHYQDWSTAGNNWGGRQFSRSTDGGSTWLDPINIPGSPVWGTLDVATNCDLYLGGLGDTSFLFNRSTNAKDKSQTPSFDRTTQVDLGGAIVFASPVNPAGLLGQTWIATDKSSSATAGNIYMLCSVGVDNTNPCDVNFSRSTDGGKTWSKFIRVPDTATNKGITHWFGTLAVAPNGRIDACWYDNRANPSVNNSALFITSSYNGGLTWSKSVQVTPYFNPNIGYPNQDKMGDYLGLISSNASLRITYAATFNGEEDIWFLQAPPVAGGATDASTITKYSGTYVKGAVDSVRRQDFVTYDLTSLPTAGAGDLAGVQADYFLNSPSASTFSVKVQATTTEQTTAMAWLFNWATGHYDNIGASPMNTVVKETKIGNNKPAAPYVDPSGRVRVIFQTVRPVSVPSKTTYGLSIDVLQLVAG